MTLDGTNTWILRGQDQAACVVVDPGPDDEGHVDAIVERGPVGLILVTHGHPDHVAGLPRLRELCPQARVLSGTAAVGRCHASGLSITGLATPGHTSDSVSFLVGDDPDGRTDAQPAVLTGDTIVGRGTTVVAYPDGDLGAYLDSLDRLGELGGIPVLPGHGPALADVAAAATYYAEHRRARLDQVRAAVAAGARTVQQVLEVVYADVDRQLWPYAGWSVQAQLAYLGLNPS
jgi:glyoxylase-like metal-dependent hydrolase (beta-lactamase superfamily II)